MKNIFSVAAICTVLILMTVFYEGFSLFMTQTRFDDRLDNSKLNLKNLHPKEV